MTLTTRKRTEKSTWARVTSTCLRATRAQARKVFRVKLHRTSTVPRRGEVIPTTFPYPNRSPPRVATSSTSPLALSIPRRLSTFVEARAIASALEMLPPNSSAAYRYCRVSLHSLRRKPRKHTQATSKRVLRALSGASTPNATVTLCSISVTI